jgi:arsenate reductase-like glutaredoxin family protein
VGEQVDAKKAPYGPEEALRLARAASEIFAAKGKKVVHVDMKAAPPADAALLQLLLGPSGNLRAPTLRRGTTLIVGFDPETYRSALQERAPKT